MNRCSGVVVIIANASGSARAAEAFLWYFIWCSRGRRLGTGGRGRGRGSGSGGSGSGSGSGIGSSSSSSCGSYSPIPEHDHRQTQEQEQERTVEARATGKAAPVFLPLPFADPDAYYFQSPGSCLESWAHPHRTKGIVSCPACVGTRPVVPCSSCLLAVRRVCAGGTTLSFRFPHFVNHSPTCFRTL